MRGLRKEQHRGAPNIAKEFTGKKFYAEREKKGILNWRSFTWKSGQRLLKGKTFRMLFKKTGKRRRERPSIYFDSSRKRRKNEKREKVKTKKKLPVKAQRRAKNCSTGIKDIERLLQKRWGGKERALKQKKNEQAHAATRGPTEICARLAVLKRLVSLASAVSGGGGKSQVRAE